MRSLTPVFALVSSLGLACQAALADTGLSLGTGFDYSTGKYGSDGDTEIWYYPVIGKYESVPLTFKFTGPYLRTIGPGNIVGGAEDRIQLTGATPGGRGSDAGLGDVVGAASYSVYDRAGLLVDATGKIKFGAAADAKGLGTGKNDYALQGDVTKRFGQFAAFGSLGWKKLGDAAAVNFKSPWYGSLGGTYKVTPSTSAGLTYDYRQRVITGGSPVSEATGFVSYKFTQGIKLQGYVVTGFADRSRDWGGGALLNVGF